MTNTDTRHDELRQMLQTREAIARLGAGQYGSCVECTDDIPEHRRDVPSFQTLS